MLNGITYIVRPRIAPSNRRSSVPCICFGAIQLLVGPASSSRAEQMKVRSSTRATSLASERARKELGRFAGLSGMSVPCATISAQSRSYSSLEPSHQCTRSGLHLRATSSTQARSFRLRVRAVTLMPIPLTSACRPNGPRATDPAGESQRLSPSRPAIGSVRFEISSAACGRNRCSEASRRFPRCYCTNASGARAITSSNSDSAARHWD